MIANIGRCSLVQIGEPFDYNIHNAIMRENTNEFDEDVVCKVSTSTTKSASLRPKPSRGKYVIFCD